MTTATAATISITPAGFEDFLASRDEPGWVTELRKDAFEVYQRKLDEELDPEEWKRVDLRAFRPGNFGIETETTEDVSFDTLMAERADFAGQISHVNGHTGSATLQDDLKKKGVLFGSLIDFAREHRELIEPVLMRKAVPYDADRFAAWHAAFWTGGTVLYVPRNVEVTEPVHSLIGLTNAGAADFSHTLIVLEDGAQATLLEETVSGDEESPGLHVGSVELLVGRGAQLRYVQLQNWNQNTYHFAHQAGRVEASGSLQWTVGGLGGKLAHIHQDIHLDGRGSEAQVNGVSFAVDRQKLSYYTQQSHNAPDTRTDLLYKEVLRDRARMVWRGMIKVEKEAQQTDGYQRSDALLLSPTSRCDSIPGLEIEADDVRCTHGATVGRVDEEQIFYAMSRGMTEYEAMHMIVEGFFHGVYDRIPVPLVRETLSQAVERKLGIERVVV